MKTWWNYALLWKDSPGIKSLFMQKFIIIFQFFRETQQLLLRICAHEWNIYLEDDAFAYDSLASHNYFIWLHFNIQIEFMVMT